MVTIQRHVIDRPQKKDKRKKGKKEKEVGRKELQATAWAFRIVLSRVEVAADKRHHSVSLSLIAVLNIKETNPKSLRLLSLSPLSSLSLAAKQWVPRCLLKRPTSSSSLL